MTCGKCRSVGLSRCDPTADATGPPPGSPLGLRAAALTPFAVCSRGELACGRRRCPACPPVEDASAEPRSCFLLRRLESGVSRNPRFAQRDVGDRMCHMPGPVGLGLARCRVVGTAQLSQDLS